VLQLVLTSFRLGRKCKMWKNTRAYFRKRTKLRFLPLNGAVKHAPILLGQYWAWVELWDMENDLAYLQLISLNVRKKVLLLG